ncbi:MAG TPA: hypothetical protein VK927_10980, partial [Adhaeribacter sp.]|nr:hypothetical protein [Adhaeribacter sp.]
GAVIAAIPPTADNHLPDPDLLRDPNYRDGFRKKAHGKKAGKAAAGFGLGVVAAIVFYIGVAIIILSGF